MAMLCPPNDFSGGATPPPPPVNFFLTSVTVSSVRRDLELGDDSDMCMITEEFSCTCAVVEGQREKESRNLYTRIGVKFKFDR